MKGYLHLQGASGKARMLIKSLSETFVNFNSFRNAAGEEAAAGVISGIRRSVKAASLRPCGVPHSALKITLPIITTMAHGCNVIHAEPANMRIPPLTLLGNSERHRVNDYFLRRPLKHRHSHMCFCFPGGADHPRMHL